AFRLPTKQIKMKEYKIIRQKGRFFQNSDLEFEKDLNQYAREGWSVVNTVFNHRTHSLKVILERDKR
ncbi:MAG: DUF4177 domain-containing protein, partial [Maribacter sp.]|nr:DUF4177 domain-containing protein [Maribacter sp.]